MLWDIYTTASGLPILRFGGGNGGATTAIAVVGYTLAKYLLKKNYGTLNLVNDLKYVVLKFGINSFISLAATTGFVKYPTTAIAVFAPPIPPSES